MNIYLIAADTESRPDCSLFFQEPTPPSNYKDPDKIRDWVNRAIEKQIEESADTVLGGQLVRVCVQLLTDKNSYKQFEEDPAGQLVSFVSGHRDSDVLLVGPDADLIAQMAAMEMLCRRNVAIPTLVYEMLGRRYSVSRPSPFVDFTSRILGTGGTGRDRLAQLAAFAARSEVYPANDAAEAISQMNVFLDYACTNAADGPVEAVKAIVGR